MMNVFIILGINLYQVMLLRCQHCELNDYKGNVRRTTKTIEDWAIKHESDRNSMIALAEKDIIDMYDDFYDERDATVIDEQTMDILYFGPPSSFMRLDTEALLHILVYTKKHLIPISKVLLAWDLLTDGKTAAYLQGREYLALGSLLNFVPEEELYYVNFGDATVLKFFARVDVNLQKRKATRQIGILITAYRRYYGSMWYTNGSYINELGYLFCGLPSQALKRISPVVFKEISLDIFGKLMKCNTAQLKTLYNIATQPEAYGLPYKWSSHEINRLGLLFTVIPDSEIGTLPLASIPAISDDVLKQMNQNKLQHFTKQQVMRMNMEALRIFIIRMQLKVSLDMDQLVRKKSWRPKPFPVLFASLVTLLTNRNGLLVAGIFNFL